MRTILESMTFPEDDSFDESVEMNESNIVDRSDLWQDDEWGDDNEPGWFEVWGDDTDINDVLEELADRLASIGVTIEMINDDDGGKVRLMHNGKPLGE